MKRNNISKDEESFNDKLNEIIKQLNDFDIKKNINKKHKKKNISNSNNKSKDRKNNNNKSKSGNKNKHKSKINNTVLGNNINDNKYVKLNYFNKSTFRKNTIFNLKNGKKMNNSINLINNSGLNKLSQNGKNKIKIIEHNIFKRKQLMSKSLNKNAFHSISCSTSIKKELSKSKMNSSNNSKKNILTGSSSPFNILNNINFSFNKKIKNHHKKSGGLQNGYDIKRKNHRNHQSSDTGQNPDRPRCNRTDGYQRLCTYKTARLPRPSEERYRCV